MQISDRKLAIIAALIFLWAGIAGGKDHWHTPNGFLPNICLLYLPCFAVWFGRRLQNPIYAIGLPAGLGGLLILPSLVIFMKDESEGRLIAILMTVILPAIIAAGARLLMTLRPSPKLEDGPETLRSTAGRNRLIGLIGIVFFPQLVQPATLDVALRLKAAGDASNKDQKILGPADNAKWIALVVLGIIGLAALGSLLMASMDAFL